MLIILSIDVSASILHVESDRSLPSSSVMTSDDDGRLLQLQAC